MKRALIKLFVSYVLFTIFSNVSKAYWGISLYELLILFAILPLFGQLLLNKILKATTADKIVGFANEFSFRGWKPVTGSTGEYKLANSINIVRYWWKWCQEDKDKDTTQ